MKKLSKHSQTKLVTLVIILLLFVSIFDPADQILQIKVPVFICLWILFLFFKIFSQKPLKILNPLFMYLLAFIIIIPSISILRYVLFNPITEEYLLYLWFCMKPLFFLSLLLILCDFKINATNIISKLLLLFSVSIFIVFILIIVGYDVFDSKIINLVYEKGLIQKIDFRDYGGFKLYYIYFVTAPLLVISTAYYTEKTLISKGRIKWKYLIFLIISFISFFLTGSRNSIIISLVTPLLVYLVYSRNKIKSIIVFSSFLFINLFYFRNAIFFIFSSNSKSNLGRLSLLGDYIRELEIPSTFLFGQGLGATFYVSVNSSMQWIAELTFLEIIRHYGIFMGGILIIMLFYPFINYKRYSDKKYLLVAYFGYLLMCITNPFIFSSSGMIMLSIILYPAFIRSNSHSNKPKDPDFKYL